MLAVCVSSVCSRFRRSSCACPSFQLPAMPPRLAQLPTVGGSSAPSIHLPLCHLHAVCAPPGESQLRFCPTVPPQAQRMWALPAGQGGSVGPADLYDRISATFIHVAFPSSSPVSGCVPPMPLPHWAASSLSGKLPGKAGVTWKEPHSTGPGAYNTSLPWIHHRSVCPSGLTDPLYKVQNHRLINAQSIKSSGGID